MALLSVVGNRAVARKKSWLVRCQVALYGNQGVRGENEFMRELYPMQYPQQPLYYHHNYHHHHKSTHSSRSIFHPFL